MHEEGLFQEDVVVMDASVIINLLAVANPGAILKSMPSPTIVSQVFEEVQFSPGTLKRLPSDWPAMFGIQVVDLHDDEVLSFLELCGANPPDDLDDGEAASLAVAASRSWPLVVDDKKARRIARSNHSNVRLSTSVDVFRHAHLVGAVVDLEVADFVFDALRVARMRVPAALQGWVLRILEGKDLSECRSLPRRIRDHGTDAS